MQTTATNTYKMIINGKAVESVSGEWTDIYNPATGEVIASVPKANEEDVDEAVKAAKYAFEKGSWSKMDGFERSRILRRAAELMEANLEELAKLETLNTGKPISESRGNVAANAKVVDYYSTLADKHYGETIPLPGKLFDYTVREPLGVCGLIVPWNFPIQAIWKIAPALAAGNTVIVKPASLTPLTAIRVAEIFLEAGVPEGVLNVITGPGNTAGTALVTHPDVEKVSLTGETGTGKQISKLAADTIKKVSLELGGKSASIVLPDADLDKAVNGTLPSIFGNAGQRCTARSRLFLHESIKEEFLKKLVDKAKQIRLGDPLDPQTQMGTLISQKQLAEVEKYVAIAKEQGAEVLCGGSRPAQPELENGAFYLPTILDNVKPDDTVARDEVFGPVLVVRTYTDLDAAIEEANDSIYGLAGTVWTRDIKTAHIVASRLKAGNISINHPNVNFIYAPFGGYKQSGLGREMGKAGLEMFTQVKNIVMDYSDDDHNYYGL